jgi:hypothetical protein
MRRLLSRFTHRNAPSLDEDDRVLHLFRNRAELKKERSDLQDEILRLKDILAQQQGATAHVEDQLARLEQRLADTVTGHQALVYYHLRDLWKAGTVAVTGLIAELSAQQEERERRAFLADYNGRQFGQRENAAKSFNAAQDAALASRAALAGLQQSRQAARHWWQYFRRRELDEQILAQAERTYAASLSLEAARKAQDDAAGQGVPEFPGLSVLARRSINLAAIVYAELLLMPLLRTPVQGLMSDAMRRREPSSTYGDQQACDDLVCQIAQIRESLPTASAVATELRQRTELLLVRAAYDFPDDVVPSLESIGSSALGNDYWDLRRLLLS